MKAVLIRRMIPWLNSTRPEWASLDIYAKLDSVNLYARETLMRATSIQLTKPCQVIVERTSKVASTYNSIML